MAHEDAWGQSDLGDRNNGSIVPFLSVKENLFVNQTFAGMRWFSYVAPAKENVAALDLGRRVGLRPNQPNLPIEALSGGNQQKVVVGRWLNLDGKVYVFEDPTAGVDVGAKDDIYKLFNLALENSNPRSCPAGTDPGGDGSIAPPPP